MEAVSRKTSRHFIAAVAVAVVLVAIAVESIPSIGAVGALFWLVPAGLFYGIVLFVLSLPKLRRALAGIGIADLVATGAIVIVIGAVFYILVSSQDYIYYWDQSNYWNKSRELATLLGADPLLAWGRTFVSINNLDYNYLPSLFTSVPLMLAGGTFAAYVTVVYAMFVPPAIALAAATVRALGAEGARGVPLWVVAACYLGFAACAVSMFNGYIDEVGMVPMLGAYAVVAATDTGYFDRKIPIALCLALLATLILRRYFAYWVVGFTVALVMYCLAKVALCKTGRKDLAVAYLKSFGIGGAACAVIMLVLFHGYLARALFNDYATAYSAYDSGASISERAVSLFWAFGLVAVMGMAASLLGLFACKRNRVLGVALVVNALVATVLFWRVQDFYLQHYLVLAPELLLLVLLGVKLVAERLEHRHALRAVCFALLAVLCALSFLNYSCLLQSQEMRALFGSQQRELYARNDMDDLRALVEHVSGGNAVYIVASSPILNREIITNGFTEFGVPFDGTVSTSDVDLRDGFNTALFDADTVVVCEPAQTHLKEGGQRVVTELTSRLLDDSEMLGSHYEDVAVFELDEGVKAHVLERVSDYTAEDVRQVEALYDGFYSDSPELFRDRFEEFIGSQAAD